MAMGSFDFGLTICGIRSSASSEPSIRTSLGRTRSRSWRKCQAAAGERWRTPKMCGDGVAGGFTKGWSWLKESDRSDLSDWSDSVSLLLSSGMRLARRIKAAPGRAPFLHHVAEIIFPDDEVFLIVFDDSALKS